ncbi:MAG: hypothetical protein AAFX79_13420 [Planctomycetota bacterium]
MFADIKNVVDVIRTGASGVAGLRSKKAREDALLELLSIYFVLLDVVEDGRALLELGGCDPLQTLERASDEDAATILEQFKVFVHLQAGRLYSISGLLMGQDVLSFVDPTLRDKVSEVVGYKGDRVKTLHGVGSGLVISTMFGITESREEVANLVQSMYTDHKYDPLDVSAAAREIDELEQGLNELRAICERFASDEELLLLTKKARKRTRSDPSDAID